jgi:hypothetical protein
MKLKILLVAVFVAGLVVSFAIAAPPPGKGKGHGKGKGDDNGAASTSTSSDGTTTNASGKKTLVCHRTHSQKKPWHLIWVSNHAVPAHLRHGDVLPTGGQCPSSVTTSTTTSTTTESSTTTSESTTTTQSSTTTTSNSPARPGKKHG